MNEGGIEGTRRAMSGFCEIQDQVGTAMGCSQQLSSMPDDMPVMGTVRHCQTGASLEILRGVSPMGGRRGTMGLEFQVLCADNGRGGERAPHRLKFVEIG